MSIVMAFCKVCEEPMETTEGCKVDKKGAWTCKACDLLKDSKGKC